MLATMSQTSGPCWSDICWARLGATTRRKNDKKEDDGTHEGLAPIWVYRQISGFQIVFLFCNLKELGCYDRILLLADCPLRQIPNLSWCKKLVDLNSLVQIQLFDLLVLLYWSSFSHCPGPSQAMGGSHFALQGTALARARSPNGWKECTVCRTFGDFSHSFIIVSFTVVGKLLVCVCLCFASFCSCLAGAGKSQSAFYHTNGCKVSLLSFERHAVK